MLYEVITVTPTRNRAARGDRRIRGSHRGPARDDALPYCGATKKSFGSAEFLRAFRVRRCGRVLRRAQRFGESVFLQACRARNADLHGHREERVLDALNSQTIFVLIRAVPYENGSCLVQILYLYHQIDASNFIV